MKSPYAPILFFILSFLGLDGFDVRKIDDIEYTVEISCYFLTKWRDDRLLLHEDILKGSFFNYVFGKIWPPTY